MPDVFISYARADRAHAEQLADRLSALGLSVWKDLELEAGVEFDKEIEARLDAAKAVVVLWSVASVESVAVRSEAHEALAARKLVPVRIDQTRPPLLFRSLQTEDFSDWTGEETAVCFQRVAIEVVALAKGQEAAAALPFDGVSAPSAAPREPAGGGLFRGAGSWLTLLAIIAAFGANFSGFDFADLLGSAWGSLLALAAFALALFQFAERDLTQNAKAMVARWLRPEADARPVGAARAFLAMFEAVFTRRHFSLACFWRSAVASILLYAALLLALVDWSLIEASAARLLEDGVGAHTSGTPQMQARKTIELNAALLFLAVPLTNIVVDYFSLWQTRMVLKLSAWRLPILIGVILDALLTGLVFVLLLPVGPMIGVMIQGGFTEGALEQGGFTEGALEQALAFGPSIWQFGLTLLEGRPFGEVEMVLAGEAAVSTTSLFIAFVTTFTTSVWLWLALLFAPLFRLMSWSRGAGLSMMGRLFNVRARPIAALGYLTAALIVTVGGAGAWAGKALRPAASGTFQDCAGCPEMIAIPGGTFVMGSPEDEEGRSEDEGPLREVTVSPFAMGVYEVTFREWDACVAEGFCACVDDGDTCKGGRPDDEGWGRGLRPAINVTKANVAGPEGFIDWLNSKVAGAPYRLPSEAEWEYAARAGAETRFWVGDMLTTDDANFNGKTRSGRPFYPAQTLPVGGPANAFGLHDVHGNVWEWVADCYAPSYEGAPSDGAARDADAAGGCESVSRGGSWGNSSMRYLRLADRGGVIRGHRLNPAIGFRVARTLDP